MESAPTDRAVRQKVTSRRLFFALWPSAGEQQLMERSMREHVLASGGRPIPAHNLHVTLAFLGEVPELRIAAAVSCAARVGVCGPIDLEFNRVEVWKRAGVLSLVTALVPRTLSVLVDSLQFNLLSDQFEIRQEHVYRPHVTLARDVKRRVARSLTEPIHWRAEQFVLVQSESGPSGSKYTVLHNWVLIQ